MTNQVVNNEINEINIFDLHSKVCTYICTFIRSYTTFEGTYGIPSNDIIDTYEGTKVCNKHGKKS